MTLKTSNLVLRPYQNEAIKVMSECSGHSLFTIPMAGGKTEIFLSFAKENSDKKILCVFNTVDLVEQTNNRAIEHGIDSSVFCSSLNQKTRSNLTMASLQTIYKEDISEFDFIIFDECHRAFGDSKAYKTIISKTNAQIFGFTATPYNANGPIFGDDFLFKDIKFYVPFAQLLDEKFIVPIVGKDSEMIDRDVLSISKTTGDFSEDSIDEFLIPEKLNEIILNALKSINQKHKKIAWWCSSIKHADMVASRLNELGEKAISYHSQTKDRSSIKTKFENGDARHVSFVNIISEGYSYSPLSLIVCLRPTNLYHLWVQTCGRVNRIYKNKTEGVILDYAGNFKNLGHPYTISPWDIPKLQSGEKSPSSCTCENCKYTTSNYFDICPKCLTVREKTVDRSEQSLKKLNTQFDSDIFKTNEQVYEYPDYYRINDYISKSGKSMKKVTLNSRSIFFYTEADWGKNQFFRFKKGLQKCLENKDYKICLKMNEKGYWTYVGIGSFLK